MITKEVDEILGTPVKTKIITYNAVIVADVEFLTEQLHHCVMENCPEINVVDIAHSPIFAEKAINRLEPDIVFIDIDLSGINAFVLFKKLKYQPFDIIFTSVFGHCTLQAFGYNPVNYLIKPLIIGNIKRAVQKYTQRKLEYYNQNMKQMLKIIGAVNLCDKKIRLPKLGGFEMVSIKKIIRLEAEGRYTKVFIQDDKPSKSILISELISQNIKRFEEKLSGYNFFRCHHSHLVNLNWVKSYTKGEGGILGLENGESIPVSKSNKDELLKRLSQI